MSPAIAQITAQVPTAILALILGSWGAAAAGGMPATEFSLDGSPRLDRTGSAGPLVVPVERGTTFEQLHPDFGRGDRLHDVYDLDPGLPVEGDNLGRSVFTRDGNRVLVTNMMTDNVTVFDWPSLTVVANIPVGDLPYGIAVTDDYAVVACPFSDAVYAIRLSDLTVAGIIPTGDRPWIVRTSPDGDYAYASCEISDTCEKIDLNTMTRVLTIHDFPMELTTYSYNSENGRFWPNFLAFEVTHDGDHIVTGNWNDSVLFYDTATGAMDHAVPGIANCVSVALSGDGTRAVAMSIGVFELHQIDLATFTRTATVAPADLSWGSTYEMGVNQDGSKVFLGVWNNQSAIVRFPTHDVVTLSQTGSPFWVGTSPDHALAVCGQNSLSVVDFATSSVVGQAVGRPHWSGSVSPAGMRAAAFDPHRFETLGFYDFTVPGAPIYRGARSSGQEPEGDAARRVLITPDGSKALVANVLSGNLTILDLETITLAAIVPVGDHPQEMAITSDSRWALISSSNPPKLSVLDLSTLVVVADVPCGVFPGVIGIAPGDETAYVGDIAINKVFAVHLAGAASQVVAEIPVGEIGRLLLGGMIDSDVEVSPDGNEVLVAVSFENKVRVIDTHTNSVVAEIWVNSDFPLQIAFDETGDHAIVTNYIGDTVTIMRIDGAASTRIDVRGRGDGPLRIDSNPARHEIGAGIIHAKTVVHLDPATGDLLGTDDYSAWGSVLQVRFDERGDPIVLAIPDSGSPWLIRGGEAIAMPAVPYFFDYCPATQTAVAACPGPDYAVVVKWDTTDSPEVVTVPRGAGSLDRMQPNPVIDVVRIGFSLPREGPVELTLVDPAGRTAGVVACGRYPAGRHEVNWSTGGFPGGTYFTVLKVNGIRADTQKISLLGR